MKKKLALCCVLLVGSSWILAGSFHPGGDRLVVDPGGGERTTPAVDTTPPDAVTKLTTASGDMQVALEWATPGDSDYAGTLVLRHEGSPVPDSPVDGTTYGVGDAVGASVVACVTTSSALECTDNTVTNDLAYYFSAFAFDTARNYASGTETVGHPRSAAEVKWAFTTSASSLAPVGVVPLQHVVGIGNDQLLHRFRASDGIRGSWSSPLVGGAVQDRPMVGDLDAGPAMDLTAFLTAQDGRVYRYALDDGTATFEGSADAVTDAGCTSGILQAGPVIMVDAFDSNANNDDDAVIVVTRCGATDNKVLLYSHDLATLHDSYDGGVDGLGIANASPLVIYRDTANNIVFVPVRSDGGESVVALEVKSGPAFDSPPYGTITGIGDIDARPAMVRRNTDRFIIFGNTLGELYLYSATVRDGSSLRQLDTLTTTTGDGPVKGIAVSTGARQPNGFYENWVLWTTDTTVHGIQIGGDGRFKDSSYWSISLGGPSRPLVLRWVGGTSNTLAYVGSTDGYLYELDASNGNTVRTFLVETGKTVGDPSFDYNDGTQQGLVVGTSSGAFYRVNLD
ncbi:MAG: hypothetical protein Q9Q40_05305 [Acidobacteriota bacterium]|nr:hypothetical protein [Acidobacteriota bacterium]MDQ7087836.1 hypothetical protein [Acidobacteriota bacterium]